MLPYIAAPWIRHGIWRIWKPVNLLVAASPWNSGQVMLKENWAPFLKGQTMKLGQWGYGAFWGVTIISVGNH